MAHIDEQLAGLATLSPARLRAEWRRLYRGRALPEGMTPTQMKRAIAWRLQERAFGSLPPDRMRELDRLAMQLASEGDVDLGAGPTLKPGSRLVRKWHDRVYCVTVLEEGYAFEDRQYSSLTQIARHITGAAWSGPRFLGLKGREGEGT